MASPLAQFEIKEIIPLDIVGFNLAFTNSALTMLLSVIIILSILYIGLKKTTIIPNKIQSIIELSYEFIGSMISDNIGSEGKKYLPFVFTLFFFILVGNLIGMLPFSFTWTSHIIVTFAISFFIFLAVTLIAIYKHGIKKFLFFFAPSGVPVQLFDLICYVCCVVDLIFNL